MFSKRPSLKFTDFRFWLCLQMCCLCLSAHAGSSAMRFENASTYLDDGVYYLDAFARVEIGDEPEKALLNGVELHFLVEVAVVRNRRWWIDKPVVQRSLRYKLYFYELTRHFRVENLQTGESRNTRSLGAALRTLGQINRFALIKATRLKDSRSYTASINLSLDSTRLPGPLAARAVVSNDWDLQSEEFQWSLN